MAHDNNCQNCGKPFTGNINKRFCGDACRRYFKRHDEVPVTTPKPYHFPDKSGQNRTTPRAGGSNLVNYAAKKGIDIAAKYLEKTVLSPDATFPAKAPLQSAHASATPLVAQTADEIINNPLNELLRTELDLPLEWKAFFGAITYPFKMLVWGLPGSGKSSFCMQLANLIGRSHAVLYIAGEEELNCQTMVDKQRRLLRDGSAQKNCVFLPRLPQTTLEWKQVMQLPPAVENYGWTALFYDSVTQLGISPFYVQAASREFSLSAFPYLSHIFITHAHKDGQEYRGDGSWAHEVDVVVRVERGQATTLKNRFGEVGRSLRVF